MWGRTELEQSSGLDSGTHLTFLSLISLRKRETAFYQSILKEISSEYSLEGLMLKLQYFGHSMPRTDSLEKTLMLEKIEGRGEGDNKG